MDERDQQSSDITLWQALTASWLSMRTPVKLWLFFLNAVFLASLFFWPSSLTFWVLVCYVASAPFMFGIMIIQRGLTRMLGLAHLIPWIPLLVYLVFRLAAPVETVRIAYGTAPAKFSYTVFLLACLTVCLAFDLYDVYRWIRGERYVLGSKEAVDRGVSYDARIHLEGHEPYEPNHQSDRIGPDRGWFTRLLLWVSERMFGQPLAGIKILGHKPSFLLGITMGEMAVEGFDSLDERLRSLVTLRVAQIVGCPW